jgi:hypothetical protein
MIKIGDRVRFLNAVGGGVVTRFIKKDVVGILEEDGFETPVLVKECVVIESVNHLNFPVAPEPAPASSQPKQSEPQPEEWEESEETDYGNAISLYLGVVPANIKSLFNSSFDLFLINDSNYSLGYLYSVENHKQKHQYKENGTMRPNTKLFLESFEYEGINKIRQIIIQAVAFKKKGSYEPKPTLDFAVKPVASDFNKLHTFAENDFFEENALIIPLIEKDLPAAFIHPDPEQIRKSMLQKEVAQLPPSASKEKQKEKQGSVVEVDLHIHQLLDSTAGMDNAAMLHYQMDKFRETLAQFKNNKGRKIVFIHGKGDGVLRNEIVKELKAKYPSYYFQDASFRDYGFGATMVTIR